MIIMIALIYFNKLDCLEWIALICLNCRFFPGCTNL